MTDVFTRLSGSQKHQDSFLDEAILRFVLKKERERASHGRDIYNKRFRARTQNICATLHRRGRQEQSVCGRICPVAREGEINNSQTTKVLVHTTQAFVYCFDKPGKTRQRKLNYQQDGGKTKWKKGHFNL